MALKTVNDVINALRPGDLRKEFWVKMHGLLVERKYLAVMSELRNHSLDSDFEEQVLVVANTIVEYSKLD
jgi:hypothetical protein